MNFGIDQILEEEEDPDVLKNHIKRLKGLLDFKNHELTKKNKSEGQDFEELIMLRT